MVMVDVDMEGMSSGLIMNCVMTWSNGFVVVMMNVGAVNKFRRI